MEVPHGQLPAGHDANVGNAFTILVQRLDSGNNVIQMLAAELTAVYGKANHIADLGLLLGRFQVILHRIVAELRRAYAVAAYMCGEDGKCMKDGMCTDGCMCMKDGMCTEKCMCMDGSCMKDGKCTDSCMCSKDNMDGKDTKQ